MPNAFWDRDDTKSTFNAASVPNAFCGRVAAKRPSRRYRKQAMTATMPKQIAAATIPKKNDYVNIRSKSWPPRSENHMFLQNVFIQSYSTEDECTLTKRGFYFYSTEFN